MVGFIIFPTAMTPGIQVLLFSFFRHAACTEARIARGVVLVVIVRVWGAGGLMVFAARAGQPAAPMPQPFAGTGFVISSVWC